MTAPHTWFAVFVHGMWPYGPDCMSAAFQTRSGAVTLRNLGLRPSDSAVRPDRYRGVLALTGGAARRGSQTPAPPQGPGQAGPRPDSCLPTNRCLTTRSSAMPTAATVGGPSREYCWRAKAHSVRPGLLPDGCA